MSKVYALDVDETMETSGGPVKVQDLRDLHEQGHIVGLCGALCRFLPLVSDWHRFISFTLNFDFGFNGWYGPQMGLIPKAIWLHCFQHATFPGQEEYVLCGNIGDLRSRLYDKPRSGASDDVTAALKAGWEFMSERDFVLQEIK